MIPVDWLTFFQFSFLMARQELAATNQQFPNSPCTRSLLLAPSTNNLGLSQISCNISQQTTYKWLRVATGIFITTRTTAGTAENPPANKLHNVTSRLISNTIRKYIYNIVLFYHPISEERWITLDVTFKVTTCTKVKSYGSIRLPIYGSLLMFNRNTGANWTHLRDIGFKVCVTLTLTFQGHPRSNVTLPLDSPYMVSYWCLPVNSDIGPN